MRSGAGSGASRRIQSGPVTVVGRGVGGAGRGCLGQRAYFGDRGEERAGAGRGEVRQEGVPVDGGDDDGGVAAPDGVPEGGHGRLGRHGRHAVAAGPFGAYGGVGETSAVPGAPGDGGGGEAVGAALFGEGVEVGVGGGVVRLARVAEGAGGRREQDERVQVQVTGELVQCRGGRGLGAQYAVEAVGGECVDDSVVEGARGVDDGREGCFGGDVVEDPGQGRTVRRVADGDGHAYARPLQFRAEFGCAGGVGAAAAGQDEVLGARTCEAARHMSAQRTRTAGDEDRAAGRPGGVPGQVGAGRLASEEAAGEDAGAADGELVLGAGAVRCLAGGRRQDRGESGARSSVVGGGYVDESAPAVGVFEGHGPAEAPEVGLHGVVEAIAAAGRHGTLGEGPHPGIGSGVAEGLHERRRGGESRGYGVVAVQGRLVEAEQGDDARERGGTGCRVTRPRVLRPRPVRRRVFRAYGIGVLHRLPQPLGQESPCRVRRHEAQGDGLGAGFGEGFGDSRGPRMSCGAVGQDDEPPAGQVRHRQPAAGQRLPGDAVAPAVDDGTFAPLPPPGGEARQYFAERVLRHVPERGRQLVDVLALHGLPEACLVRVLGGGGRRSGGGTVLGQPEVGALEGVGGQVDDGPSRRARSARQSSSAPWTWASAREVDSRRAPPSSRRSEPRVTAVASAASIVAWTGTVSTGCGLISRNRPCPSASRPRVACSNKTVWRRLRYQ